MDKKKLFDDFVSVARDKGVFTGTWLYAENGEIVSKGAVGFRDPEDTKPMEEASIFELASVSKQFTAAAVMLLIKRGLLSLEDELLKFFPENPYKGITIYHLLTHTSGLPDHEDWSVDVLKDETVIPKNDLCIRFLKESGEEPLFAPGEKWEYCNTAYCILAEIVEKVSGVPFEEFMQKEIFEPAGMKDTRVCHIRIDGIPFENFARGLVFYDGKYAVPDDIPAYRPWAIMLDGESGVGFVYTNVFDMFKWDRALREGRILSHEEQKLMYSPAKLANGEEWKDEDGESYGFGWSIANDPKLGLTVSHSGSWPGYDTWFMRGVDSDRMLVVLCCREAEDYRGIDGFFEGMKAISLDREPEPIKTIEDIAIKDPDKTNWSSFCGKYEFSEDDYLPVREVFMKDGELYVNTVDEETGPFTYKLYPTGENEFGRKCGLIKLTFSDGAVTVGGKTYKKL